MTGETVYVLEFLTPYEPGDFEGVFSTPERAKSHARAFNDALEWVDTGHEGTFRADAGSSFWFISPVKVDEAPDSGGAPGSGKAVFL